MKLATLPDAGGGRDGRLVVVSRDLAWASDARHVAPTLQAALDDWERAAPQLELIARGVEAGAQPVERFHEREALAPLPRAFGLAAATAYPSHGARLRGAGGRDLPDAARALPPMRHGAAAPMLAPRSRLRIDPAAAPDIEAQAAVILGDVPLGADRAAALAAIRLVTLLGDVTLHGLVADDLAGGLGFFLSKPGAALAPVAVAPDALAPAWSGARLSGVMRVDVNGAALGRVEAGAGMDFDFADLIVHAARTRPLPAGTVLASGAVSDPGADAPRPASEGGSGFACRAELRAVETAALGAPRTPFLGRGDVARIEMRDAAGHAIFGAIELEIAGDDAGAPAD